jgi:hypothetical protein
MGMTGASQQSRRTVSGRVSAGVETAQGGRGTEPGLEVVVAQGEQQGVLFVLPT